MADSFAVKDVKDLIGLYPDALDSSVSRELIKRFDGSDHTLPGRTGHGFDPTKKDSQDLCISTRAEFRDLLGLVIECIRSTFTHYIRQHPVLLSGALALSVKDTTTGALKPLDISWVQSATDDELARISRRVYRIGSVMMQRYTEGRGGYHYWHSEVYPRRGDSKCETLHRVLFVLLYLNTVERGGETEFFFQERLVAPREGSLLIAPASFTHTHRGRVPLSSNKFVLATWVLFRDAEALFGGV